MTDIPMPVATNPELSITQVRIISFDVYGTLVQYKQHILNSFKPLIARLPMDSPYRNSTPLSSRIPDSATTGDIEFLKVFQKQEDSIKLELASHPLRFDDVLKEIWRRIAKQLNVSTSDVEVEAFGSEENVKSWPCFAGTVEALRMIQDLSIAGGRRYRLVALSNIDKWATDLTFAASGLGEIKWDKVFTAENFGSGEEDLKLADQRKLETLLQFSGPCPKDQIIHVAQSLGHDHAPAKKMGISSVFLIGDGPVWGKEAESRMAVEKRLVGYGWRFNNITEFANMVRNEVESTN